MKHLPAIPQGPIGAAGDLLGNEALHHPQNVVSELLLVEEVAELVVPLFVLVVIYGQEAIDHPIGVLVVFSQLVPTDLGRPAGEILSIEEELQRRASSGKSVLLENYVTSLNLAIQDFFVL